MTAAPAIHLADPDDPRAAPYRDLRAPDAAVRRHGFVVEGAVALETALGGSLHPLRSILVSDRRAATLAGLLKRRGRDVELLIASQAVLDAICGFPVHRGVMAYGASPVLPDAARLLGEFAGAATLVCAIGVNDVDNMGAIFRNAAAFGAAAVLLDPTACDPLYRRAIRVSVGASLLVPFARLGRDEDVLALLEAAGFEPLALSPSGGEALKAVRPFPRTALILGAEGPGLAPDLLARVRSVRIPMAGGFDSLNVATAGAVALHHLLG